MPHEEGNGYAAPGVREDFPKIRCFLDEVLVIHGGHILVGNFGMRMPILMIISDLENPQDCRLSDASVEYTNPAVTRELILASVSEWNRAIINVHIGETVA